MCSKFKLAHTYNWVSTFFSRRGSQVRTKAPALRAGGPFGPRGFKSHPRRYPISFYKYKQERNSHHLKLTLKMVQNAIFLLRLCHHNNANLHIIRYRDAHYLSNEPLIWVQDIYYPLVYPQLIPVELIGAFS